MPITDFEKIVVDILIGLEVTELIRLLGWLWFKIKPHITSRRKRHREVVDDD